MPADVVPVIAGTCANIDDELAERLLRARNARMIGHAVCMPILSNSGAAHRASALRCYIGQAADPTRIGKNAMAEGDVGEA